MASIAEIRQQYPQYNDMNDQQLADAMYKAHYSDMPRAAFDQKIGLGALAAAPPTFGQKIHSEIAGVTQAPYDLLQSGVELGARGTDAIGLTKNAYGMLHGAFQQGNNDAAQISGGDPNSGFYKGGRIAGQVLATAPVAELNVLKGAPLLANLPRLARIGDAALQGGTAAAATSNASDKPLVQQIATGAAAGSALPLLGTLAAGARKLAPEILGVTTGVGPTAIKTAFQSGRAGGETGQAFTDAMRGNTPVQQVVSDAKDALANIRADRNTAYRSGMVDISKDASVLSFDPLDQAMGKAGNVKTFKGIDTSPKTADVRNEITGIIDKWRALDPAEYHTPEGFDALKQMVGDVRDSLPYNTPQRIVADQAYNAVRKTIADQAPAYDKVMKDYSVASDEIDQIQRELSLKPGANPQTTLKKLQSIINNNVNTNYGGRAALGQKLTDAGATTLLPQLAGQSMSATFPRGLGRALASGEIGAGLTAALAGHPVTALAGIPAMVAASPRAIGELSYGAGAASRGVSGMFGNPALRKLPALPLSPMDAILASRLLPAR